jgi:glucosamine--fructose-6-phosphate aminotransferase (isomerizing)
METSDNRYIADVLDTPSALARTLSSLGAPLAGVRDLGAALRSGRHSRMVLTGLGASLMGLNYLLFRLTALGHGPLLVDTADLLEDDAGAILTENALLVVSSQSGRTAEVVRLLARLEQQPCVAITNDPTGPLAQRANFAYVTAAGEEHSIPCKTFVTALAAMALLACDFTGRPRAPEEAALKRAIEALGGYLARWREHAEALSERLVGARSLLICSRSHSLCAGACGALVLREAAHVHAESVSGSQFRHGHMEMLRDGAAVLLLRGYGQSVAAQDKLANDIVTHGGSVVLVGQGIPDGPGLLPEVPDTMLPLLEIVAVQLASIGLAHRLGHEPGLIRTHPKVQTEQ